MTEKTKKLSYTGPRVKYLNAGPVSGAFDRAMTSGVDRYNRPKEPVKIYTAEEIAELEGALLAKK